MFLRPLLVRPALDVFRRVQMSVVPMLKLTSLLMRLVHRIVEAMCLRAGFALQGVLA